MEPATMSDLQDLMKELRVSIKEAVAEAFGNSKPTLEHATTSTASQLLAMDASGATVLAPACSSPDQRTSALDLAPTSARPLDIDDTGVSAATPTTCSTYGFNQNADGGDHMAVWQAAWSTTTSFIVPPEDSPTPSREPSLGLALRARARANCSTEGSEVGTDSIVSASMSGAVTTLYTAASMLCHCLQRVPPWPPDPWNFFAGDKQVYVTLMTLVSTKLLGCAGTELRPRTWPMLEFNQGNARLNLPWQSFSCNCRTVQVWSTLPQAIELAFCIVHQRVRQAVEELLELILTVTRENRGSNISAVSVLTPLMHRINTCSLGNILLLNCRAKGMELFAISKSCVCSHGNKYMVAVTLLELCAGTHSYRIKPGIHPLYASTRRALILLLFEWPLSACREFLVATIIFSIVITCTAKLCSAGGTIFSFSVPLKFSSHCEQHRNLANSDASILTPTVQIQSPYSVVRMCLSFLCDIMHSFRTHTARNGIDKGSSILVAQLQVLIVITHDSSEPDGMANKFQRLAELDLGISWHPLDENQIPYFCAILVTNHLFDPDGTKCLNALLNILHGTADQLATIMLDWIEPQLVGYGYEIVVYGKKIVLCNIIRPRAFNILGRQLCSEGVLPVYWGQCSLGLLEKLEDLSCNLLLFSLSAIVIFQGYWYLGLIHNLWIPHLNWQHYLQAHWWMVQAHQATSQGMIKKSSTWHSYRKTSTDPKHQLIDDKAQQHGVPVIARPIYIAFISVSSKKWWTKPLGCSEPCQWSSMLPVCASWTLLAIWGMYDVKFLIHQEHPPFQGGRSVTLLATLVDHNYYPDEDSSFNLIQVDLNHGYYREGYICHSSSSKEHQVLWVPSGKGRHRLGVKPSFKEGGVLAVSS